MRTVSYGLLLLGVGGILLAQAPGAVADPFPFTTAGEFANFCEGASPREECLNAIMEVEQVVDSSEHPNDTCDGGPDALLEARTNEELDEKLTARAVSVVVWLKHHAEYANQSYGDGIWAALKGVYCQ